MLIQIGYMPFASGVGKTYTHACMYTRTHAHSHTLVQKLYLPVVAVGGITIPYGGMGERESCQECYLSFTMHFPLLKNCCCLECH